VVTEWVTFLIEYRNNFHSDTQVVQDQCAARLRAFGTDTLVNALRPRLNAGASAFAGFASGAFGSGDVLDALEVSMSMIGSWTICSEKIHLSRVFQRILVSWPSPTSSTSMRTSSLRCLFQTCRPV
jgi:hypothetical protein